MRRDSTNLHPIRPVGNAQTTSANQHPPGLAAHPAPAHAHAHQPYTLPGTQQGSQIVIMPYFMPQGGVIGGVQDGGKMEEILNQLAQSLPG